MAEKRRWVYTGARLNSKDQLGHQYYDEETERYHLFGPKAKPSRWPQVGAIYTVHVEVRGEVDLSPMLGKNT